MGPSEPRAFARGLRPSIKLIHATHRRAKRAALSSDASLPHASRAAALHLQTVASDVPSWAPPGAQPDDSLPYPPPQMSGRPKKHGAAAGLAHLPPSPSLQLPWRSETPDSHSPLKSTAPPPSQELKNPDDPSKPSRYKPARGDSPPSLPPDRYTASAFRQTNFPAHSSPPEARSRSVPTATPPPLALKPNRSLLPV